MSGDSLARLFPTLLLIAAICLPGAAQVQALLVGVGDYPPASGWNRLHAGNDIALLRTVLEARGVAASNIRTLQDAQATREGILLALEDFSASLTPGATAYFHFSGHGQQVRDDNGDELDGLDEALAPYDAQKFFRPGAYEGQQHLRDDALHRLFTAIRRKLGPTGHLLVSMDACHSGTVTRGMATSRGTDVILADSAWLQQSLPRTSDRFQSESSAADGQMASMVALFSAAPHQLSYETSDQEGRQYGLFTYSLARALSAAGADGSYRSLLDCTALKVCSGVAAQTPQMEGDPDLIVLNGKSLPPVNVARVTERIDPALVVLNAGALTGFTESAQVVFYPADVRDTAGVAVLSGGVVEQSTLFDADVLLDTPLPDSLLYGAWVWLRASGATPGQTRVVLDVPQGRLREKLSQSLEARRIARADTGAGMYISSVQGFAGLPALQLFAPDERLLHTAELREDTLETPQLERLLDVIEQHQRMAFLRALDLGDALLDVRMELEDPDGSLLQRRQLVVGDTVRLRLTNTGARAFYFSVLDIQPDDQVRPLIPFLRPAIDYRLQPGQTYTSEFILIVEPPVGTEVFKVFATPEPLDLSGLCQRNAAAARSAEQSGGNFGRAIARLLGNTPEAPQTRSAALLPGSGAVRSLFFEIKHPEKTTHAAKP